MEGEVKRYTGDSSGEREYYLGDLFWMWAAKYRLIIVLALVFAVLLGAYGLYKGYKKYKAAASATEKEIDEALERERTNTQRAVENLRERIERTEAYRDNALILQIDPGNVHKKVLMYYVTNHYEINTDSYYQNPNNIGSILEYYNGVLSRVDLDEALATSEQPDLTVNNPVTTSSLRLVNISINTSSYYITITMYGDSQERVDRMASVYQKTIADYYNSVCQIAGEHDIDLVVNESTVEVDERFGDIKLSYDAYLEDLYATLEKNLSTLGELDKQASKEEAGYGLSALLKDVVKYGVVGVVLGMFLSLFVVVVKKIMDDSVVSVDSLSKRQGKEILGVLPVSKKKLSGFDVLSLGKLGLSVSSLETAEKLTATNIRVRTKDSKIALINVDDDLCTDEMKEAFAAELEGVELKVCNNPIRSSVTVNELQAKSPVVLVVRLLTTNHKDITNVLQTCKTFGNEVLGFIVLCK